MFDEKVVKSRMDSAIDAFSNNLKSVRTGKASSHMFDSIVVNAYGSDMPINQLANVNVPDSSMVVVQPWDKKMLQPIEKAIQNSNLGVNPVVDSDIIRIPVPKLSSERRQELVKICSGYLENCKVSVRNNRRDFIDGFKKAEKSKEISEDEMHNFSDKVQKITDEYIKKADNLFDEKKKELTDM